MAAKKRDNVKVTTESKGGPLSINFEQTKAKVSGSRGSAEARVFGKSSEAESEAVRQAAEAYGKLPNPEDT